MSDPAIERLASEQREYQLATNAIAAILSIAEKSIEAIDGHSKSPAVAAMMHQAGGNNVN